SRLSSLSFPSSLARRDPPSCPTRRSSDLAYQRHLRRARLVYLRRRRALLDALATALPGVRVGGVAAGLHLVVPVPGPAAEAAAVAGLRAAGVPAEPLGGTSSGRAGRGVVVGTARVREGDVPGVVQVLRAACLTPDEELVR